jgi:hypothetical protein
MIWIPFHDLDQIQNSHAQTIVRGGKEAKMRGSNSDKLNELVGKLVGDLGAAIAGAGILLGDRLGIYDKGAIYEAQHYCFAGPGPTAGAAGLLDFCWAVFFFGGGFTNRLKQLRRSSSSFTKRQSCTVLAGAKTCFGAGFILSS